MTFKRFFSIILFISLLGILVLWIHYHVVDIRRIVPPLNPMKKSVDDILAEIGVEAKQRMLPWFDKAKVSYPPQRLALLGFKAEKRLEVWAEKEDTWILIRHYPILAASGVAGPKLREGDRQVPEGIYRLNFLNPNSRFHLSMQINYPNEFDQNQAAMEQRTQLGGDIFIHGKAASIGCLAMGDEAIEELFVLVATISLDKVKVILAPQQDMEKVDLSVPIRPWVPVLYSNIRQALAEFK